MFNFKFVTERSYDTSSFAQYLQQKPTRPNVPDTPAPVPTTSSSNAPHHPSPSTRQLSNESTPRLRSLRSVSHGAARTESLSSRHSTTSRRTASSFASSAVRSASARLSSRIVKRTPRVTTKGSQTRQQLADTTQQKCCLCSSRLDNGTVYQCRQCPGVLLCSICILNAPCAHPLPGHTFDMVKCGSLSGRHAASSSHHSLDRQGRARDRSLTRSAVVGYQCHYCDKELMNIRFECQDCPDVNCCYRCSGLHPRAHSLKAIPFRSPNVDQRASSRDDDAMSHHLRSDAEPFDESDGEPREHINSLDEAPVGDSDEELVSPSDREPIDGSNQEPDGRSDGNLIDGIDEEPVNGSEEESVNGSASQGSHDGYTHGNDQGDSNDNILANNQGILSTNQPGLPEAKAIEDFLRATTKAMEAIIDATRKLQEAANGAKSTPRRSTSQLHGSGTPMSTRRGRPRKWFPRQREQLAEFKQRGLTDEEIAVRMGRTSGAVKQQWKKQQLQ